MKTTKQRSSMIHLIIRFAFIFLFLWGVITFNFTRDIAQNINTKMTTSSQSSSAAQEADGGQSSSNSESPSSCTHSFNMKQILHAGKKISHSSDTSPCSHVFYPVEFFKNQSSPGYPFKDKFQNMWFKLPSTGTGTHRFSFESSDQSSIVNLDFVSVPKAASTTMNFVFRQLHNKSIVVDDERRKLLNMNYLGMFSFYRGREAMQLIHKNNSTASMSKIWTFMREPVSRFVSAVGQEMNLRTARAGRQFREKCLSNDNPTATLQCAINHVRDIFNGDTMYNIQIHFIPSAVIYYRRMFSQNLPLEVIDFKDVNKVTKEFLMLDDTQEVSDIKRNSRDEKGDQLASLTVSALTEDMIKQICEIYAVDVLIMRHLNLSDKYCQHIEF